jgi:DNA-binding Xre family transcriptional regulator
MQTQWKLEATLRQYQQTPIDLVRASGLTKTTVYNIVNAKAQAVEIETLDKLVAGLEKLIGKPMSVTDVIERQPKRNALLEEALKTAKPFNWEELKRTLPEPTPEEQAENEAFMQALEEQRQQDRQSSIKRDQELLELFSPTKPAKSRKST